MMYQNASDRVRASLVEMLEQEVPAGWDKYDVSIMADAVERWIAPMTLVTARKPEDLAIGGELSVTGVIVSLKHDQDWANLRFPNGQILTVKLSEALGIHE